MRTCGPSTRPARRSRIRSRFSVAVAGCLLLSPLAAAQPRVPSEPLVLALAGVTPTRSAPPAAVLWFLVAPGPVGPGPTAIARQSAVNPTIASPDQPSTWATFDAAAAPTAIVAVVSDNGITPAIVATATALVERTIRESTASGLSRPAMMGRIESGLAAHFRDVASSEVTSRLLGLQELRLNAGDISGARVGLVVDKQLDFSAGRANYRVRFQLAGVERFKRAPSP